MPPPPPTKEDIKNLLAEGLGIVDHLVHDLPALIVVRGGDHKLFHLLELVDAEDASGVAPMGSDLRKYKHDLVNPEHCISGRMKTHIQNIIMENSDIDIIFNPLQRP